MRSPSQPTPQKIEQILTKASQECISEINYYLNNDIPYNEEHITCMMVYHIVGKIPRYSCGNCKMNKCLLTCFREKLSKYIDVLPDIEIEQNFPTLHISGENVSFCIWTRYGSPEIEENILYNNISMTMCLPYSQPQRILYDEYKLSPEAIPIIDNQMPTIRLMIPDIINRALSSHEKRQNNSKHPIIDG